MRQQISRLLILVTMFGLLIFASAPSSNAIAVDSLERCCLLCDRQYSDCLASWGDEVTCCEVLRNCQANCPGVCPLLASMQGIDERQADEDIRKQLYPIEALKILAKWNLKDDNLDHQSEETRQFLINLLVAV